MSIEANSGASRPEDADRGKDTKLQIDSIIPIRDDAKRPHDVEGIRRDENDRPLCPGELPMRQNHVDRKAGEIVFNCPVKRPTHLNNKHAWNAHVDECPLGVLCEPNSKMGPLVHIRFRDDPRRNVSIPRSSAEFALRYEKRTAAERFNSTLKSKGKMATGAYRREHISFSFSVFHAIECHTRAWVKKLLARHEPIRSAKELFVILEQLRPTDLPAAA